MAPLARQLKDEWIVTDSLASVRNHSDFLISVAKLAKYFYFREESFPFLVENFLFATIFPDEKAFFSLFGLHFHFCRVLFLEK